MSFITTLRKKTAFSPTLFCLIILLSIVLPATADESGEGHEFPESGPTVDELIVPGDHLSPEIEAEGENGAKEITIPEVTLPEPKEVRPFHLLGEEVPPGNLKRLSWYFTETSAGLAQSTPVLVAHGKNPGPVLCVVAAIHGDELNGIEIVRELLYGIDPSNLSGTVVGVPIVNLHGFRQGSRYLSDRRDLNRFFPGNPRGSSASRIADSFFNSVIRHCNYVVDLHTGSFNRANLPQLRADLNNEGVSHMTKGFGGTVVLHGKGPEGSLRRASTEAGIPAVTVEAGEPMRFQPEEVSHGIKALRSLLNHLDMVSVFRLWRETQPTYYESRWVRTDSHGILKSSVSLGQTVREGDVLGTVTDPITNIKHEIVSPHTGTVLGMALNQTMMPGYAAYHIGIRTTEQELVEEQETDENPEEEEEQQEQPNDDQ